MATQAEIIEMFHYAPEVFVECLRFATEDGAKHNVSIALGEIKIGDKICQIQIHLVCDEKLFVEEGSAQLSEATKVTRE